MSLILNIDTAIETASVTLAIDAELTAVLTNGEQADHAAWLHPAIESLFEKSGRQFSELEAVAVTIGPGSYTGLRVGLAAAKGFCYALGIPLVAIGTLEMMADTLKEEAREYIAPLIDARRMEVFAAIYDKQMVEIISPRAMEIDRNSFGSILASHQVVFCGSGSGKMQAVMASPNAEFMEMRPAFHSLAKMSYKVFLQRKFADMIYTEPLYLKDFHTSTRKD